MEQQIINATLAVGENQAIEELKRHNPQNMTNSQLKNALCEKASYQQCMKCQVCGYGQEYVSRVNNGKIKLRFYNKNPGSISYADVVCLKRRIKAWILFNGATFAVPAVVYPPTDISQDDEQTQRVVDVRLLLTSGKLNIRCTRILLDENTYGFSWVLFASKPTEAELDSVKFTTFPKSKKKNHHKKQCKKTETQKAKETNDNLSTERNEQQ